MGGKDGWMEGTDERAGRDMVFVLACTQEYAMLYPTSVDPNLMLPKLSLVTM